MSPPLAEARDLRVAFPGRDGWREVVRGVSFRLGGEKLGIVGESGSGKSLTTRALLGLLPRGARVTAEALSLCGEDVLGAPERKLRRLRGGRVGLILQDPKYALNPVMTAGAQVAEAWRAHRPRAPRRDAEAATIRLFEQVRLRDPSRVAGLYPHELSGGMGQRVMIAMMLAPDPELLIADEPTSALDASVQAEILALLDDLVSRRGLGLILISHDLPLVSRFCDRVVVMYAGRVMEELPAAALAGATHPYTRGLLGCLPSLLHRQARLPVLARDPAWLDP